MSIFDKLAEERFEIPFSTRAAHFHRLMQPFGIPEEPVFTKEAKAGMLKIAVIMDQAEGQDEAIQQMQRQALVDPQVQQALDYQQLMAEREDAVGQLQQMNQQLVETETRAQEAEQRAMQAEQAAQDQGAQMQEIQGQLEQEQQGRQQATQMAVQARDQSLQEQIGLQEQKQNIAMQAEAFQQQANALSQQLRQTAAQPTAPPLGPAEAPGAQAAEAANQGEMPPPATEEAAQEQQEAANAQQEAAVQGQQAQQATEEDLAKQEAAAQQGGGMTPEEQQAMQEQEAAAQQQAAMQEQQMMEQQAMAEQAMAGVGQEKQSSINVDLLFKKAALMKHAAGLPPEARGAIIGAAIGALGGVASGAIPGAMTGKSDSPGAPTGGALRGGARGAMAGAISGATGGALLGNAIGKGDVGKQLGKAIGGGALVLGAPAVGALAGLGGARSQDYRVKQAAMEKVALKLAPKSLSLANPSKRITSRMTNARNVGKPTGKPGNIGQLTESAFMPKTGAEKNSEMGKCSACGKMAKLSEMGKCGVCGAKEKTAAGIMVSPKGSRRLSEQEEAALLMNAEKLPREIITGVRGSLAEAMQGLMPKTAGEKAKAVLEFAKRKAIGGAVGGLAGAGVGAAEVGKHRLEAGKGSTKQPSDKELKAEGKLHAAKLKAQRSPSYGNKINVARLQLKRDVEKASRENPGGHVGRRAAEGALVGVLAEGGGRGLIEKAKAAIKG